MDIKNNDIHEDAIDEICQALKANTTVTWLDMSDNFSHGKGDALADLIRTNKTITYLDLSVNQLTEYAAWRSKPSNAFALPAPL